MLKTGPEAIPLIYTIGHSNCSINHFVSLLKLHDIQCLADVRSSPYSKYASHFNSPELKYWLKNNGIKYLFMGKQLGGKPVDQKYYDQEGYVLYSKLAGSAQFIEGIARLEKGLKEFRIAVLCSEENPGICHRSLLIGHIISAKGVTVKHIRGDGSVQEQAEIKAKISSNPEPTQEIQFPDMEGVPRWRSARSVLQRSQLENSLKL